MSIWSTEVRKPRWLVKRMSAAMVAVAEKLNSRVCGGSGSVAVGVERVRSQLAKPGAMEAKGEVLARVAGAKAEVCCEKRASNGGRGDRAGIGLIA